MSLLPRILFRIFPAVLLFAMVQAFWMPGAGGGDVKPRILNNTGEKQPWLQLINATFLGNEKRNYYGDSLPDSLGVIWRCWLGKGTTVVSSEKGEEEWYGAGWTGQPLLVSEGGRLSILQGCFDHQLKKFDAATGQLLWQYAFDDVIKGTATLWQNAQATDTLQQLAVMQGSRAGVGLHGARAYSFRAVSYYTGAELWRMNIAHGPSYSRDCDASPLVLGDTAYLGLENASFVKFLPGQTGADTFEDNVYRTPAIVQQLPLSNDRDAALHGGNLVTEASPVRIGDHLYIASGAGHVFGYNLRTQCIDWDFYIGADLDGTPAVTADSCLLVPVEKQYIAGCGGVFKLNPRRAPAQCVDWFFPTGDAVFSGWKGGVVGSVAVNDTYRNENDPYLAAFTGIDGKLCVVEWNKVRTDTTTTGPDGHTQFPCPQLVFRTHTGASISTPLFSQNRLLAAGYNGIRIFEYNQTGIFRLLSSLPGIFEATPVTHRGKVYVASRDGYLYCLGGGKANAPASLLAGNAPVSQDVLATAGSPGVSGEKKRENAGGKKMASAEKPLVKAVAPSAEKSKSIAVAPTLTKHTVKVSAASSLKSAGTDKLAASPQIQSRTSAQKTAPATPQLITGVFRSSENAARSIKLWQERGYTAAHQENKNGMIYIVIAQAGGEISLSNLMREVNEKYHANAWIMNE
ncbi:MAG: PQQ-binding-like beta-propeller repeat protein [Bacteroidia bacterium]|jgi:outer membrane protein assembly factor BamB|nr:PQQ-binding-like beta-propeller repeat protein [Bacteroidia bacterium]